MTDTHEDRCNRCGQPCVIGHHVCDPYRLLPPLRLQPPQREEGEEAMSDTHETAGVAAACRQRANRAETEVAALRAENERLLAIALAAEEVGNCGLGGMRVTPRQASAFDALAAARARGGGEAMTDTSEAQRTRIEAQITALKTENARYREALEEIAEAPGCESWLIARAALRGKP